MIDWPVGLSTGCFFERSFFDCIEEIGNAGFGIVEICSFPKHLDYRDSTAVGEARALLDRLIIEPYSFHAPFREEIDISSPEESHRQHSVAEVIRAADAAAILGVRYFVIHPGPERGGIPPSERVQRMQNAARSLDLISQRCREKGVWLALENMLAHLFTGPVQELLWVFGALRTTDIGICLDTGHAFLARDLHGILHKVRGHLAMVHASDNLGDRDDHLPPGKGRIDWPHFLRHLANTLFRGTIILEIAGGKDAEQVLHEAKEARRYLGKILRTL